MCLKRVAFFLKNRSYVPWRVRWFYSKLFRLQIKMMLFLICKRNSATGRRAEMLSHFGGKAKSHFRRSRKSKTAWMQFCFGNRITRTAQKFPPHRLC
jgi:hypothetical protein